MAGGGFGFVGGGGGCAFAPNTLHFSLLSEHLLLLDYLYCYYTCEGGK